MGEPRFRLSSNLSRFYAGHQHDISIRVYRWDDDPTVLDWEPDNLSAYTSVKFQAYENDSSTSLLKDVSLTVQTGAGELEGGVANKATGTVTFSAAVSRIRCKIVTVTSGAYTVVESEWEADVFVGGPTS